MIEIADLWKSFGGLSVIEGRLPASRARLDRRHHPGEHPENRAPAAFSPAFTA